MEKTLSMGAFTELDEREVMEVEGGGSWFDYWYDQGAMVSQAIINGESVNPAKNFANGTQNYINQFINTLRNAAMPKGIPNSTYDWTTY